MVLKSASCFGVRNMPSNKEMCVRVSQYCSARAHPRQAHCVVSNYNNVINILSNVTVATTRYAQMTVKKNEVLPLATSVVFLAIDRYYVTCLCMHPPHTQHTHIREVLAES